jgi:hypothetical protein
LTLPHDFDGDGKREIVRGILEAVRFWYGSAWTPEPSKVSPLR